MAGDRTAERRERVRQLWIYSDKEIAERLLEEGFGEPLRSRKAEAKRRRVASMQRNVWNDRAYWRKTWREQRRLTSEDAAETRGEYLARIDSYREVGLEILGDDKVKGTPRVQALMALTRLEEARAKATGVEELEPPEQEDPDAKKAPVVGVVLGTKNLTPEMREQLRAQGIDIDDEDEDE